MTAKCPSWRRKTPAMRKEDEREKKGKKDLETACGGRKEGRK